MGLIPSILTILTVFWLLDSYPLFDRAVDIGLLATYSYARGQLARSDLPEPGLDPGALFDRVRAAGVKTAALRRVDGRRHIARKHDALASRLYFGIGDRDRRYQRAGTLSDGAGIPREKSSLSLPALYCFLSVSVFGSFAPRGLAWPLR